MQIRASAHGAFHSSFRLPARFPKHGSCRPGARVAWLGFTTAPEALLCAIGHRACQEISPQLRKKGMSMPNIDLGARSLGAGNLGMEINSLQASRATAE